MRTSGSLAWRSRLRKPGGVTTSFAPWAEIDARSLKEAEERERKRAREQQKVVKEAEECGRKQKRQRFLKGLCLSQARKPERKGKSGEDLVVLLEDNNVFV